MGTSGSRSTRRLRLAIIGSVGVPGRYGGFETLVENLATLAPGLAPDMELTIYCSARAYPQRAASFHGAKLRYLPLNANGAQSIPYDILSLAWAVLSRVDVVLVLGVSGAVAIPLFRRLGGARIVTNVDGIEWKREKWRGLSRWILRLSERLAARHSHAVIADNDHIAAHIRESYGVDCETIAYGGDHALAPEADPARLAELPAGYALSICRIEPENNVRMIVEAFAQRPGVPLVLIGNWAASEYGRDLRDRFGTLPHLFLLDPIYDLGQLKAIREQARFYVHGHSAGGTNPSLVEAMQFHEDILAFDCGFNRATTENGALFFQNCDDLGALIDAVRAGTRGCGAGVMKEIADRRYAWSVVAQQYFRLVRRMWDEKRAGITSGPQKGYPRRADGIEKE